MMTPGGTIKLSVKDLDEVIALNNERRSPRSPLEACDGNDALSQEEAIELVGQRFVEDWDKLENQSPKRLFAEHQLNDLAGFITTRDDKFDKAHLSRRIENPGYWIEENSDIQLKAVDACDYMASFMMLSPNKSSGDILRFVGAVKKLEKAAQAGDVVIYARRSKNSQDSEAVPASVFDEAKFSYPETLLNDGPISQWTVNRLDSPIWFAPRVDREQWINLCKKIFLSESPSAPGPYDFEADKLKLGPDDLELKKLAYDVWNEDGNHNVLKPDIIKILEDRDLTNKKRGKGKYKDSYLQKAIQYPPDHPFAGSGRLT